MFVAGKSTPAWNSVRGGLEMERINKFVTYLLILSLFLIIVTPPFAQEKQNQQKIICPKCGAKNLPTAKFCAKCGTKLPEILPKPKEEIPVPVDSEPPELTDLTVGPAIEGKPLLVRVKVQDEGGIDRVNISYMVGEEKYSTLSDMKKLGKIIYQFIIPKAKRPWIQYAVTAWDSTGNMKVLEGKSGNIQIVEVLKKKKSKTILWLGIIGLVGGTAVYLYLRGGREGEKPVSEKLMNPPPMPGN